MAISLSNLLGDLVKGDWEIGDWREGGRSKLPPSNLPISLSIYIYRAREIGRSTG
jgi:hypothetical protein